MTPRASEAGVATATAPPADAAPAGAAGTGEDRPAGVRRYGLVAGPVLFAITLLLPLEMEPAAQRTAAAAVLMATWWMSEALPLAATALLPLVLLPLLGILRPDAAAAPYANPVIFLFMGGFILALAMERWALHRRIALAVVGIFGAGPERLVLGFMLATAFLSMWISNTATAAMMLPIGIALAELLGPKERGVPFAFGTALMLGIAYAATIGGVGTIIGTPPNAVFAAAARDLLDRDIGFVEWMLVGVPVVVVLLPLTWAMLVYVFYRPGTLPGGALELLREERARLGPMSRGETLTLAVFALTAAGWLLREPKTFGAVTVPGLATWIPGIDDSTIAVSGALLLFTLPIDWRRGVFVMDWATARRLPWGVLLLFGGGLALARGFEVSGLTAVIGQGVAGLAHLPLFLLLGATVAVFVYLSELASNTAIAAMSMPILAAAAAGMGQQPLTLMAAGALAASCAFMLPVGTPPNALVFGTGYIRMGQMVRAGFWLNIIAILLVTTAAYFLVIGILR